MAHSLRRTKSKTRAPGLAGRLAGAWKVLGPGLITGAADDDPSGIGTYSQVGAQFGFGLLWSALLTLPLMAAVQELCARIGLVTGEGLGQALRRKYPDSLVGAALGALLIANTINIGADLGAVAAGIQLFTGPRVASSWLVAGAAAVILALLLFRGYKLIATALKWLSLTLFAYVVAGVLAHPSFSKTLFATFVPQVQPSFDFVLALVAVLGTTISPYLFFWQASSEVEEHPEQRPYDHNRHRHGVGDPKLKAARIDVFAGMTFSNVIMYFVILTAAATLYTHGHRDIQSAAQAAKGLEPLAGQFAYVLFAAGIISTGFLAIPVLAGSGTYAVNEFLGKRVGLDAPPQQAKVFYALLLLSGIVGVGINLIGVDPIKALFYSSVINGVAAPPLLILIALLGRDREIMGPRTSGRLSTSLTWAAIASMSVALVAMAAGFVAGKA